jgi:cephalosporin-C deacetylase
MPALDKPLDELRTYLGSSPRPDDFDAYWDAALRELDATPPEVELKPVAALGDCGAELFDLYFTGVGGARVHAKYLRPKTAAKPGAGLVHFHGYGGNSGDWSDHLAFALAGISIAAMDCRGQGGDSRDNLLVAGNTRDGHIIRGLNDSPEQLLYRRIFLDTVQLARVVMAQPGVDPARVGAMGGSQGGGLALACAALEPRLARVASLHPFLSDYRRVWNMDLAKDAYAELRYFFRHFDPLHEREDEIFTRLGYIDVQYLAPRIRAETLMGITLMDTICPPSSQFAAYNRITAKKQALIYPDFGHERAPGYQDAVFRFLLGLKS